MCRSNLHHFLTTLPKCEHHMHLEGSLEPELLFNLAAKNNITLPSDDAAFQSSSTLLTRYRQFTSLDDFLHYYFIGMSVLLTAQDFEDLAYAYFTKAASQNVRHAEVFFDPQAHTVRGVTYATVVEGFQRARDRAWKDLGVSSELIVCVLRHLPPKECYEAWKEWRDDVVAGKVKGLGLSSTELGNQPEKFKQIWDDARERGVKYLTAHAGEEGGVEYMRGAIEQLSVNRVDHGIKLLEDEKLLEQFATKKWLITMCPLSNVELRCVKNVGELPIREYLEKGVKFSLNSDDPAYFGGYIQENYCAVQDAFDFSVQQWETIAKNSIEGSWCSEDRKKTLLGELKQTLQKFEA